MELYFIDFADGLVDCFYRCLVALSWGSVILKSLGEKHFFQ
jgi:hypothetical protein